jgi:hypothetical protein
MSRNTVSGQIARDDAASRRDGITMNQTTHLIEQHVLESESRLRHIDELIERARRLRTPEIEAQLNRTRRDRDRLANELGEVRNDDPNAVQRGERVKGMLQSVGLELEKALTAIFERDEKPRPS